MQSVTYFSRSGSGVLALLLLLHSPLCAMEAGESEGERDSTEKLCPKKSIELEDVHSSQAQAEPLLTEEQCVLAGELEARFGELGTERKKSVVTSEEVREVVLGLSTFMFLSFFMDAITISSAFDQGGFPAHATYFISGAFYEYYGLCDHAKRWNGLESVPVNNASSTGKIFCERLFAYDNATATNVECFTRCSTQEVPAETNLATLIPTLVSIAVPLVVMSGYAVVRSGLLARATARIRGYFNSLTESAGEREVAC